MVEKAYRIKNQILNEEIEFFKNEMRKSNEFIKEYFKEKEIEGSSYYITARGECNKPFDDCNKGDIRLFIDKCNEEKLRLHVKKTNRMPGVVELRKTSKILKEFQKECIERKIVINLLRIDIGRYFKELSLGGFRTNGLHEKDNYYYLKISTTHYNSITPKYDGFEEIKLSEYFSIIESIKEN